jgi:hypothetical protein
MKILPRKVGYAVGILMLLMALSVSAQSRVDTTVVSIGYGKSGLNTLAGAIDQVTQDKMNKGLVIHTHLSRKLWIIISR